MRSRHLIPALALAVLGCAGRPSVRPDASPRASGKQQSAGAAASIPSTFRWSSTGPLLAPVSSAQHPIISLKDPSVVYFGDRWHVFATTADPHGAWSMVYLSFADWAQAATAVPYYLSDNPALAGYRAAPQVFYFSPQRKWYLVFQSGQPQYSTTDDITKPESWTRPANFFASEPATVSANKGKNGGWLDFWVICDAALCHLFFSDDGGHLYRSQTSVGAFPAGFGEPVIAIQGKKETLYEASSTYRVDGTSRYLTLVEALGPGERRYFRSFVADSLAGEWTPLADTWDQPFAGASNVTFANGSAWTEDVSHGELIRSGYDQTLTVSLDHLRFLYQGVDRAQRGMEYFRLPYRLALLTAE
jgi:endo-1,4-beta-xylanase